MVPFFEIPSQAVPAAIMKGDRPRRPTHPSLTDSLWELTQSCWDDTAENRPEVEDVAEELKEMSVYPSFTDKPSHSYSRNIRNFISLSQGLPQEPRTVAYDPSSITDAGKQIVSALSPGPNVTDHKRVASVSNRPDQSSQDPGQVTGGPMLPLRFPAIFSTTIQPAAPGIDQQKKHGIWCRLKSMCFIFHATLHANGTTQQSVSGTPIEPIWIVYKRPGPRGNSKNEPLPQERSLQMYYKRRNKGFCGG